MIPPQLTPSEEQARKPLIAITPDMMIRKGYPTAYLTMTYANAVARAGGIPVVIPPIVESIPAILSRFDGFILSGGDDPATESFGQPTHPKSTKVIEPRQSFETNLIAELFDRPDIPVLAICLGMQMLALCRGGRLNQHIPETHPSHEQHWNQVHPIISSNSAILQSGPVWSSHRQVVEDAGGFEVIAHSDDGIIEAIHDPGRWFLLGVQWHPERTDDPDLGQGVFDRLIAAARSE
ncbi:MAG: gamma-glutamyl-gamma-aminobutyrate hydrolase family protein [Phycisphaerales bacterium]